MIKYLWKKKKPLKAKIRKKITIKEFAELVKQMRYNQRRYFRMRKPDILETCKKLEKQVDDIVSELTDTQMKLF